MTPSMSLIPTFITILTALYIDRRWGEPHARLHPVVWMGNALGAGGRWIQRHTMQDPTVRDWKAFCLAALIWCALAATFCIAYWQLEQLVEKTLSPPLNLPWWAAAVLTGFFLKPLFAWTMLRREVEAVETSLQESLEKGRERLRFLVSRDVAPLTEVQIRESAIETFAENLNDSVIAPLFWFTLLGLPGAAVFRFANTADAMWGYHGIYKGQNWAWAGKWAARVDDILGYVPARMTALWLWWAAGRNFSLKQLRAEAAKTPSPNSGWPMAAMALGLGVRLAKPDGYVLNPEGRLAESGDVARAVGFFR